jgi:hypothetical protein
MMRRLVRVFVCAWAVLAVLAPAALAQSAPAASTGATGGKTPTSATVSGIVNPEGQDTSYSFQYGTTNAYGAQTAPADAGSGTSDVTVAATLSSLTPGTTYHYRVVATNVSGTTAGSDATFTTPKSPAPVATTSKANGVTPTSAKLTGEVNPKGQATDYFFEYGTTTAYGIRTPTASAGAGSARIRVTKVIGALTPATTYHYRLVATSPTGTTTGADVAFTTPKAVGGLTLGASPGTIIFGQSTSLAGKVLPPRSSHVAVTLERASSVAGPWLAGRTVTADRKGGYTFTGVAPSSNTFYRVTAGGTASQPVLVLVRFRVGVLVSNTHPLRGSLVRFHGRSAPRHRGLRVFIQRLGADGHWHTIRFTRLRGTNPQHSFYSVRVRIERGGRYRVVVRHDASHARGVSRTVRIHVH